VPPHCTWVQKSAKNKSGDTSLIVRPIGDDPAALRSLSPDLDIWDAYETIHLLMPDGSTKRGGEAVAQVLRTLGNTKWLAWTFGISILGFRPFQTMLNGAYAILPIAWIAKWAKAVSRKTRHLGVKPHFTSRPAKASMAGASRS